MTFSIVARSADGTSWGAAVASKYLAAAAVVVAARAGVGALATQAWANPRYKPDGLDLLAAGRSAQETVAALTAADEGHGQRQLGVVDRDGGSATFTGQGCADWAGGRCGPGYAVQGNILAGEAVVEAMERAWLATSPDTPLHRRLHAALVAGDLAGGDRRGRQSAGLVVAGLDASGLGAGTAADLVCDLRVDDHPDPCAELARLLDLHDLYFGTADPADLLPLEGALAAEVAARVTRLGYPSLDEWAGIENYEGRLVDGAIDPLVLAKLREADPAGPGSALD